MSTETHWNVHDIQRIYSITNYFMKSFKLQ